MKLWKKLSGEVFDVSNIFIDTVVRETIVEIFLFTMLPLDRLYISI